MAPRPPAKSYFLYGTALVAAAALVTNPAWAEPAEASYDPNVVSVTQIGSRTMVSQSTSRVVVDWGGFDVRAQETVTFEQPDSRSAILNRIHSLNASRIDGTVTAPGQVIIQNANGVIFGGSARVDVGALVATTLRVDERQFRDTGRIALSGPGNLLAMVDNAGTLSAAERGLVALVGARVANSGLISARLGSVVMAGGAAATIDFVGDGLVQIAITDPVTTAPTAAGAILVNSGRISADGGSVLLTANAAAGLVSRAINLNGIIEARGAEARGGSVVLSGDLGAVVLGSEARIDVSGRAGGVAFVTGGSVSLASGATIDATGTDGAGGAVRIGGDFQGRGSRVRAGSANVEAGTLLDVSSEAGDGGSIVVWSDERTDFAGTALAEARGPLGRGGLIETSSAGVLAVHPEAKISTRGPAGRNGTWLLDPDSIRIVAAGGTAATPPDANNAPGASTIDASTVVAALASNNVQLIAQNLVSVEAPVVATSIGGAPGGLELIASRGNGEIHISAPILLQNGNLALRAGGDILLGTNATATDFGQRAIIAVGSGTVWIQTRATGNIVQASNSAVLAGNLALIGGSVDMGSAENFTLNLAGSALDGDFLFRESNASGLVNIGTVFDPFATQRLTGVMETQLVQVGSSNFASTVNPFDHLGNVEGSDILIALSAGGTVFDTIVFSALPYTPTPPPPSSSFTDSSDHFIRRVSYTLDGTSYTFTPETQDSGAPPGFELNAVGGVVVVKASTEVGFVNQAWGVSGFVGIGGTDPDEIGFDPFNQVSEELRVTLGGPTDRVDATYRLFFSNDFNGFTENAAVQFFRTVETQPTVEASQGLLAGTVGSVSRLYGDPNPSFGFEAPPPAFSAVDIYVSSQLPSAYPLPPPTIVTNATQLSPVGTYSLDVSPPSPSTGGFVGSRYAQDFTSGVLEILPAPIAIVSDNFSRVYGSPDPPFTFNVTGLRNGETADVVMSGSQIRLDTSENVGLYEVTQGSLAPNANYFVQSYTPGILQITPAPLVIQAGSDGRIYGDPNPSWIATGQNANFTASGLVLGDLPTLITSVDFATPANLLSPVGSYAITPSNAILDGVAATNYTISYLPGVLDITRAPLFVSAFDEERIYGEPNPPFDFGTTGWRNGDEANNAISATPSTAATVATGVGDYPIEVGLATFSGPAIANYEIFAQPGTLTILPAQLLVTADNQSRLFGEPNPPLTSTTTGWRNNDDFTNAIIATLSTTALIDSDVGDYPITIDSAVLSGPASANYIIVQRPGTLVISPAPLLLVSADDFSRVYGTSNPVFTFQTTGWRGNDEQNNSVTASLTSAATIFSNVGDYPIVVSDAVVSGPGALNYTIRTFDGLLTITPAPLLLVADNVGRLYGDANPLLTFTTQGFRNGDEALYTTSANLSTMATPASNVGQAIIAIANPGLSGPNPANYTLDVRSGVLTIGPAPLTVSAGVFSRIFGDPDPLFPLRVEGLRNDDTSAAVLTGSARRDPGENVGSYPVRRGTVALTTNNYTLRFVNGALAITPAPLSVVALDQTRLYGDLDPALTFTVEGLRLNDTAASVLTGGLRRDAGENVGDYAIRQGALSLTSPNYRLGFTTGTLSITPAPLLVTATRQFKEFGDPDPAFTFTVDGLRRGDSATSILSGALARDPGENVGDYPITQGALELASINYALTFVDGNLRITPAPLTVTADPNQKIVGQPDPILTFTVEGLKLGDSPADAVSGDVERQPGEEVGTFPIGQGTIQLTSSNYMLTFVEGVFEIVPVPDRLAELSARAFDPWAIERIVRGRDPDTPADAVYRTTRYENPFIPDPLLRAYGLGGISPGTGQVVPPALRDGAWTRIDNDRTGQHADRPASRSPPCAAPTLNAVALCAMGEWFSDFWVGRTR